MTDIEQNQPRKIAILGTASTSVHDAPFNDASWKIWDMSSNFQYKRRFDLWYEIHDFDTLKAAHAHPTYLAFLKEIGPAAVVGHPHEEWPNATPFPLAEIVARFGDYFTCTAAYMIAHAMLLHEQDIANGGAGVSDIGLWGIDMAIEGEYCVSPETKVLTEDLRWIPASEVEVGDYLIAFDEEVTPGRNRRWQRARVEKADRLTRPCQKLYMEDGAELISSIEHRWLTHSENEKKWRRTDEMVTPRHRYPSRIVKLLNTWEEDKSWEAGYLAAAFDGEGHLEQSQSGNHTSFRLGFAQKDNPMSEAVKEAMAALGYRLGSNGSDNACMKYTVAGGRAKTLEFLGSIRPKRLLPKFDSEKLGAMEMLQAVAVNHAEDIGEQEVIGLKTSTGTFIAEGFASHNSHQKPCVEYYLGWAQGMGIKVYVAPQSPIIRSNALYGFDNPKLAREITEQYHEIAKEIAQKEMQHRVTGEQLIELKAVQAYIKRQIDRWQL